jgi:hypothetical protein
MPKKSVVGATCSQASCPVHSSLSGSPAAAFPPATAAQSGKRYYTFLDGVKGEDVPFIAAGACVANGYIGGEWFGKRNAIGPSPKGFVDILDALNYADSKGFGGIEVRWKQQWTAKVLDTIRTVSEENPSESDWSECGLSTAELQRYSRGAATECGGTDGTYGTVIATPRI